MGNIKGRAFFGLLAVLLVGGSYFFANAGFLSKQKGGGLPAPAGSSPSLSEAVAAPPITSDTNVFVRLSKKMVPSVVNISTFTTVKSPLLQGDQNDAMRRFFGELFRQYNGGGRGDDGGEDEEGGPHGPMLPPGQQGKLPKAVSLGTGFIIDASGLILTNNHVVADADEIKISFTERSDEKPSDAEVVGRDTDIDVALIRVKNKREMIPVALGDSDALEVGEYVLAVGNPLGHGHSVTHGIISAKERPAPDFQLANYLQTDAPINPGNSGGPLVNLKGEVIGINNAIDQRAQGIGFAIPINLVKDVLPQLRDKGTVTRGYLGVEPQSLTPELAKELKMPKDLSGVLIRQVFPGDPAEKAGLKNYDVITEINGTPVVDSRKLVEVVTRISVGGTATVKVWRSGKSLTIPVTVGARPGGQAKGKRGDRQGDRHGKKTVKPPPIQMGMTLEDLTPETRKELGMTENSVGVLVSQVSYGSLADKAGLIRGDVILEVAQKPVRDLEEFYSIVKEKKTYLLRVRRADPQGNALFPIVILNLKE